MTWKKLAFILAATSLVVALTTTDMFLFVGAAIACLTFLTAYLTER